MPGRPVPPPRDPITERTGRFQLPPPEDPGRKGLYRPNRRFLYGALAVLALLVVGRALLSSGGGGSPTLIPTSCTTPGVALAQHTVQQGDALTVEAVGPPDDVYAIYLDVKAVTVAPDGKAVGVPVAGHSPEQTQLLVSPSSLPGCRAVGSPVLNLQIKPGQHVVTLLRENPDHSQTLVASTPLTVE